MTWVAAAETLLPGVDGRGDVHETEGFCGHLQPPRKADLQAFKCEHTPLTNAQAWPFLIKKHLVKEEEFKNFVFDGSH